MKRKFAGLIGLLLALVMGVMLAPTAAAAPVPPTTPPVTTNGNPDPTSDQYSPVAWQQVWDPSAVNYTPLQTGDLLTGTRQAGFVVPQLFKSLTPPEQATLQKAWSRNDLLRNVWNTSRAWSKRAFADTAHVPQWSKADADRVASLFGAKNYSVLTPGLKGVVQRIATVITGDYKPTMPDTAWRKWMSPAFAQAFDGRPNKRFDWSAVRVTVDGSNAVVTTCDSGVFNWACEGTRALAGAVTTIVKFTDDPIGFLAQKAAVGADGLLSWVAGQANTATQVDLSMSWWIDAYEKGLGVGILLMVLVLMWQFMQRSRGKLSGGDLVESLALWAPAYLAGGVFGPPLAQFMIRGSTLLTDDVIKSVFGTSAGSIADGLQKAAQNAGGGQVIGGQFIALILLVLVIIAGFFIFISLAAQAVTVYLASAVFGIAFAWVVSARHRGGSLRIPYLFLGIVFSRPLLFLLLGLGLGVVKFAVSEGSPDATRNLAMLIMAIVVFVVAAFSPLALLRFAPVAPMGMAAATGGATMAAGSAAGGRGGLSRLGDMARRGGMKSPSMAKRARDAGRGAAGGLGGGSRGAGASSLASSAAGRSGSGSPATLTGQLLGRSRRHGGGTPSAGAANVARASLGRVGRAASGAPKAAVGLGAGISASSRRLGEGLAEGVRGDSEW